MDSNTSRPVPPSAAASAPSSASSSACRPTMTGQSTSPTAPLCSRPATRDPWPQTMFPNEASASSSAPWLTLMATRRPADTNVCRNRALTRVTAHDDR